MKFFNKGTNNDQWIIRDVFPRKTNGFFVECGAVDGINGSSCYALERYLDWKGICVEANPRHASKLKKNRSAICFNTLLTSQDQKEHLYIYFRESEQRSRAIASEGEYRKLLEDFEAEYRSRDTTPERKQILERMLSHSELIKINSLSLESILKEANAPEVIDYLSMDIETYEYEVLKGFPFDRYKIMALSIEGHHCNDLLISKGYRHVQNPFNTEETFENYFLHPDYVKGEGIDYSRKILVVSPTPTHPQNAAG